MVESDTLDKGNEKIPEDNPDFGKEVDINDEIANLLKNDIKPKGKEITDGKVQSQNGRKEKSVREIVEESNSKFLMDVLSPEIKANEEKRRKHKDWLMIIMGAFLMFQFAMVALMIAYSGYWVIRLQVNNTPFADSTLQIIFTFIGTYITSIIVELIAILRYIVKNVFDTSIAGMVKDVKKKRKREQES